jgi:hypothetical protein
MAQKTKVQTFQASFVPGTLAKMRKKYMKMEEINNEDTQGAN